MHFEVEAQRFLAEAGRSDPLLVFMHGDLGAGKTTFVKACLAQLGFPPEEVQSPTFLKLLEYRVPGYGLCLHVDGYRIEDESGVEKLSLEAYDEVRAIFVEWPGCVEAYLRDREALRHQLGIKEIWDLEFESRPEGDEEGEEKVGSILEPGGRGEDGDNPVAWRGIRWRRKSF